MNERKEQKLSYIFTPVPFVLLRAYDLLTKNDRDLLIQIASFGPKGCYLTVNRLTEDILVCGEQAFYRSVYKLLHLKLIKFKRGNRAKSNHYTFEYDTQKWRLTKKLAEQIKEDAKKLGSALVFTNEPFPNTYGFFASFNICYPSHAVELPQKNDSEIAPSLQPANSEQSSSNDSYQKWTNRIEQLNKNNTSFYVIRNYNFFDAQVRDYKAWKDGLLLDYSATELEKRYIKTLVEKFDLILKSPKSQFEIKCFLLMEQLANDGKAGWQIEGALRKLKDEYDKESGTGMPV